MLTIARGSIINQILANYLRANDVPDNEAQITLFKQLFNVSMISQRRCSVDRSLNHDRELERS